MRFEIYMQPFTTGCLSLSTNYFDSFNTYTLPTP